MTTLCAWKARGLRIGINTIRVRWQCWIFACWTAANIVSHKIFFSRRKKCKSDPFDVVLTQHWSLLRQILLVVSRRQIFGNFISHTRSSRIRFDDFVKRSLRICVLEPVSKKKYLGSEIEENEGNWLWLARLMQNICHDRQKFDCSMCQV